MEDLVLNYYNNKMKKKMNNLLGFQFLESLMMGNYFLMKILLGYDLEVVIVIFYSGLSLV